MHSKSCPFADWERGIDIVEPTQRIQAAARALAEESSYYSLSTTSMPGSTSPANVLPSSAEPATVP